jgi:hypothetical protein
VRRIADVDAVLVVSHNVLRSRVLARVP